MDTQVGTEAPSTRRVLLASLVGTSVEFYDFYIYATAASLVFGSVFFPAASPSAQLLSSYATFAVAFFARPIGAAFFGHFGDRIGRKSTLVASLMLMGGSTLLIAFLPGYAQAGFLAPVLLCVLRFGQGFGLGGEWGGAALLAVENAPPGWRARFGMFPQLGAPVGFIAANGLFLILGVLLTPEQFRAWGWRLPFLASAALVGVGLWVRLKLTETAAFKQAMAHSEPSRAPLVEVITKHPRETVAYSRQTFLAVELGAIVFLAAGIVLAGYWSDAANPRRVLMAGCAATVAAGFLLPVMLGSGSLLLVWAFLSLALLLMGFVYGPLGAFLPSLFPARVRYSGASITFNVGGILGGGLAPIAAQALADRGGLVPVGLYLSAAALISLVALWPLAGRAREN
jgi:MFS family permease